MSDDEFFDFLASCREELATKQPAFQRRIEGASGWQYDMAEETLVLDDAVFGMTPIGSYSAEYGTWLWAWANDDFPENARAASARIQSLHEVTGFRVFLNQGIEASPDDAEAFAALAVHALDAIGIYRCPSDGPLLYLAVHEPEAVNRSGAIH